MDTPSLAQDLHATPYLLHRVFADGREELVPGTETTDPVEGTEHGHRLCRLEPGVAFTLRRNGRAVYHFNHQTLALRLAPGRVRAMVLVLS